MENKEIAEIVINYVDKGYNYENILDGETRFDGNDELKDSLYDIYDDCLEMSRVDFNKKYIEGKRIMTLEEFAKRLDGREYREEVTKEDDEIAKENNFVIIYGCSDDLIEFEGAISDEVDTGCSDEGTLGLITFKYNGLFNIDSVLPHAKFNIKDDGYNGNGIIIKIGE